MRALCGAIIAAGALIGLGLVSIGFGLRYEMFSYNLTSGDHHYVGFKDMDTAFIIAFAAMWLCLVIGLGIAFVGLAYHHHRRHWEMTRAHRAAETPPPGDRISV